MANNSVTERSVVYEHVVHEAFKALNGSRKSAIERGGGAGERAQRELIPLLPTVEHRKVALFVMISELHVKEIIADLQDGLAEWVINTRLKHGLLSSDPEAAALLSSLASEKKEGVSSLVVQ